VSHEFGQRRETKIPDGPGPWTYRPENADGIVNPRNPAWELKNNTGRPDEIANPNNGPGTYDDGRRFGDDAETHKFGQRREHKIPDGPGP